MRSTVCERLGRYVQIHECDACFRDNSFRLLLIAQAEKSNIDWQSKPCAIDVAEGETIEESCKRNHWLKQGQHHTFPPLTKLASNLARTGVKLVSHAIKTGLVRATVEEKEKRLSTCYDCSNYSANTGRCYECGCFMKAKVALSSSECPIGRW